MSAYCNAKGIILAGLLAAGPAFADDHVIAQSGRAFHPGEITINRGDSLTFTNQDDFIHQVYAPDLFDSDEKAPGEKLTENFPQCGNLRSPLPYPPQDEACGAR